MYIYIFLMLHITYPYISIHVYLYIDNRLRSILISMQILPYSELHLFTYYRSFSLVLFIRAFHPCISSVFFTSVGVLLSKGILAHKQRCTLYNDNIVYTIYCTLYNIYFSSWHTPLASKYTGLVYIVLCTMYSIH